jgi:hypothetical protein
LEALERVNQQKYYASLKNTKTFGGSEMASIAEFRKADVSVILAKFILSSSYDDISNAIIRAS